MIMVAAPDSPLGEFVAFAAVGAVIGAFIGFGTSGDRSDAWSTTFEDLEPGATWIGVKVHDADDYFRARRALERERAAELRKL
jgi:hypothetical protein